MSADQATPRPATPFQGSPARVQILAVYHCTETARRVIRRLGMTVKAKIIGKRAILLRICPYVGLLCRLRIQGTILCLGSVRDFGVVSDILAAQYRCVGSKV